MPSLAKLLPQKSFFLVVSGFCILVFWLSHRTSDLEPTTVWSPGGQPQIHSQVKPNALNDLPCRHLPGADEVLVVLKTGSTEFEDKLPIHLTTTLRCYPNYLIFSDWAETYRGEQILDALEFVSPSLKEFHQDFGLYRRLHRAGGRAAIRPKERSGPISRFQGWGGKPQNPGWMLDKWKFLPMVNRTLHEAPEGIKWSVFIETDTYIFWQTLLNYLRVLDWRKPYYIGGQIWIGDILFAHGGAGFVVSRPALERVVALFAADQMGWEDFTGRQWAGDCVLGKAFKDAGVELTQAWPIWQADDVGLMDYSRTDGQRLWCKPTVSYHHVSPAAVEDLWNFEQEWIARTRGDSSKYLHHRDVFREYILPRARESRWDWDNHCDVDQGPVHSLNECRVICEEVEACLQYSFTNDMRCMTTSIPNMGEWARGFDSGWMYDRMEKFYEQQEACSARDEAWII